MLCGTCSLFADDQQAEALLKQGRVDEARRMLSSIVASQPRDARAHLLLCRTYYAQDMADAAIKECEQAAGYNSSNSDIAMWLGRAYGMKASQVSMLSAFPLAKKVRQSFERAVHLDPANVAAQSALGEYYVQAPAIVGGGLDKAQQVADKLMIYSVAKSHRLRARIADKKKDLTTAEAEYKIAIEASRTADSYVDLALFYQQHSQFEKAMSALNASIEVNRIHDASLVDTASILISMHRSPEVAERILREYLASSARSDYAPAFKVYVQLGDLLHQRGNLNEAHREYAAAVALASDYAPARKALQNA
jgi:tetratricopeptide (TPR) repeat protein